jgi:hypothetical protein
LKHYPSVEEPEAAIPFKVVVKGLLDCFALKLPARFGRRKERFLL